MNQNSHFTRGQSRLLLIAVAVLALAARVIAHDSPEHVIEAIDAKIIVEGATPALLTQRATEFRALGDLEHAADDLRAALSRDPSCLPALSSLGRVYLQQLKPEAGLFCIDKALEIAKPAYERAELYMTRSELNEARRKLNEALADSRQAVRLEPESVDAVLRLSSLQRRLGLAAERIDTLQKAANISGGGLIEIELIEALLDGGQPSVALEKIEPQLREARLRCSWLIRRARARLALGATEDAARDLHDAIEEIDGRLSEQHPDITLLAGRGVAYALLGDKQTASRELERLRQLAAPLWTTEKLAKLLN